MPNINYSLNKMRRALPNGGAAHFVMGDAAFLFLKALHEFAQKATKRLAPAFPPITVIIITRRFKTAVFKKVSNGAS